jgi:hypothetical protein
VKPITFEITNPGAVPAVYRLSVEKKGKIKYRLLNDLLYLDAGAAGEVVVWVKKTGRKGNITLEAIPAGER